MTYPTSSFATQLSLLRAKLMLETAHDVYAGRAISERLERDARMFEKHMRVNTPFVTPRKVLLVRLLETAYPRQPQPFTMD